MTDPYQIRDAVADMMKELNLNEYAKTLDLINALFDTSMTRNYLDGVTQKELENNPYYKRGWNDCLDSIIIPEPDLPNYLR